MQHRVPRSPGGEQLTIGSGRSSSTRCPEHGATPPAPSRSPEPGWNRIEPAYLPDTPGQDVAWGPGSRRDTVDRAARGKILPLLAAVDRPRCRPFSVLLVRHSRFWPVRLTPQETLHHCSSRSAARRRRSSFSHRCIRSRHRRLRAPRTGRHRTGEQAPPQPRRGLRATDHRRGGHPCDLQRRWHGPGSAGTPA